MHHKRNRHSSATREDAVLLIGGLHLSTTEWIPVNGSAAQPGPFTVRHSHEHCTMQISDDVIVVTGGSYTEDYVTEYQLADGTETNLTSLRQPRAEHACGVYQDAEDQQVLLVTGGTGGFYNQDYLSSTEVAVYTAGVNQLEWRESGQLPSPRRGLRAAMVDNVLYLIGGGDNDNYLTSILSWDPTNEYWQEAGNLAVARCFHAAVAVSYSMIESGCLPTT